MRMIDGIPVFGATVDEGAMSQIRRCARTADHVALMGDHHKGYAVPIGGVVAYTDSISPCGVGFDNACSNKAVLTDASAAEVKANIGKIMDQVWNTVSFGFGRKNDDERVDHALFDDSAWAVETCKPRRWRVSNSGQSDGPNAGRLPKISASCTDMLKTKQSRFPGLSTNS